MTIHGRRQKKRAQMGVLIRWEFGDKGPLDPVWTSVNPEGKLQAVRGLGLKKAEEGRARSPYREKKRTDSLAQIKKYGVELLRTAMLLKQHDGCVSLQWNITGREIWGE